MGVGDVNREPPSSGSGHQCLWGRGKGRARPGVQGARHLLHSFLATLSVGLSSLTGLLWEILRRDHAATRAQQARATSPAPLPRTVTDVGGIVGALAAGAGARALGHRALLEALALNWAILVPASETQFHQHSCLNCNHRFLLVNKKVSLVK